MISAIGALASTSAFSITNIYRFTVAGLNPLQLVVVGTAMEAAVFVSEIPTGVVADLYSRRLSVIIGHAGMGAALVLEASWASFFGVLTAQILWGIAYTFTSGATVAWVAGEMGDPDRATLSSLFLRTSRWGSLGGLFGVPVAFLLATWSVRAPIALGGGLELVLAGVLVIVMVEDHFRAASASDVTTWREFLGTIRAGFAVIRRHRALALLAVVILVTGGSSEAYDRFHERQLLTRTDVPRLIGHGPLLTLGVLFSFGSLLGIVVPWLIERRQPAATSHRLRRWLVWLVVAQAAGLVAFGLTHSFVVAAVSVLLIERVRSIRNGLFAAMIVPLTPKDQRATVLSTFGQFDALGQITIGPCMGIIGQAWTVPAALVTSAVVLAPAVPMVAVVADRLSDAPIG